ncbi:MAG: hypothetical protein ACOVLH_09565, partial [Roseateles sp.]
PAASAPGVLAPPALPPNLNTSAEPVRATGAAPVPAPASAAVAATAASAPPPAAAAAALRNPPRPAAVAAPPAALPGRAAAAAPCSEAMAALGLCVYRSDSPSPSSPRSP